MLGSTYNPAMPPQPQNGMQGMNMNTLLQRAHFLRMNPNEQSPGELEHLQKIIQQFNQNRTQQMNVMQQQQQQQQQQHTGPGMNGQTNGVSPTASTNAPTSFTPDQLNALKSQIHAYKLLSRGLQVPETVQQALRVPQPTLSELEKLVQPKELSAKIVDSAVKVAKGPSEGLHSTPLPSGQEEGTPSTDADNAKGAKSSFIEDNVNSGIYPYNAYRHPFTHLKRSPDADPALFATRLQNLLVPTVMPAGLDAHQILAERDRYIENRMLQRMQELSVLESTVGDGGLVEEEYDPLKDFEKENAINAIAPQGKLQALIELKSLRLVEKQRLMRAQVAERLTHGSLIPLNRAEFRRTRKPTIRDARMTEQLERKQRLDRERRAKSKHIEQLQIICNHGKEMLSVTKAAHEKVQRLGRAVLSFHVQAEKDEQKRIERISKERLKALKADDEEAYMKLIDTAKDTRITHLLRQTDGYLDSLAQAVMAQQSEGGPMEQFNFETEDGPANEATFGAQIAADDVQEDKGKVDYYAVAHRISEKVTKQPTILVGGTLKEYQIKGLQWMVSLYNNKLNGILADEMGLGKTIQTISLITFLIESKRLRGPYLVIVPLSTMTNWSGEFQKWAPSVRMIAYKGNPQQRRNLQGELRVGQFQVLLTTYEYIIKDASVLSKLKWAHMIIDEGHRMKNTQSKLTQTLNTYYHSRYRLILTGTPLQNNLPELWALLNFVLPRVFNSVKSFDEWFNTPFANAGTGDKIELNEEEALLIIRRLHKVLRPFLLRRLKKDVESELPDKVEKVIKVKMSALQSQLYKQMKKHKMIADGKDAKGKNAGVKGLSNELMQLRKICQHPFLFESVEDTCNPSGFVDDKLVRSSGKLEILNRVLPKLFATGHRVLIFFQMTKVMDIMADFLTMMGWKHLRLDGGTKTEERASFVQMFNAKDSEYKVFILSTRAGGLGLNLQTADTVIIFDSDWNPHADLQAQDRAHRIGQTKAVLILRFITEKSVEEAMYQRARYKLDIDDKVIQAGRFDNKSTQEEQEEFLRSILEADQEEEENEEAGDMNDEELNALIARTEHEGAIFREVDRQREQDTLNNWRALGNRGKPPPPLMQLEELPECYRTDEPFLTIEEDASEVGRGQRKRNVVSYHDGMDDDAWAQALEDGEDIEEMGGRGRRNRSSKIMDAESSTRATPVSDSDGGGRGRRARKPKAGIQDYETPAAGKRKRNGKAMSMTPSVVDEDEGRDQKRRKTGKAGPELTAPVKEGMKAAFNECYKAVLNCTDSEGRRRADLFKEIPDKYDYPDYAAVIKNPVALNQLRKRATSGTYRDVQQFKADYHLMFSNAMTYNQEGSWVWNDAKEMKRVFDATFNRVMTGSGFPGAEGGWGGDGGYEDALTPMDDDETRPMPSRSNSARRKQVISDEEYEDE